MVSIKQFVLKTIGAKSVRQILSAIAGHFKPDTFLRNVTIVASGTAIAQGITVAASPILTRLYTPADFGVLSIYLSVVPILTIISTLQYSLAIVLPKEERDAKALLGGVIRIASVMFLIFLASAVVVKLIGLERIGLKNMPWVILPVIAVATLVNVLGDTFDYWNIRTKSFSLISTAVVSGAIAAVLLSTGMGLLTAGWWGLVAGMLLGKVINLLVQLLFGNRLQVVRDSLTVSSDKAHLRRVLKEHSDFPKYQFPQSLLNSASQNLPAIMLVAFFGTAIGGLYAIAMRAIGLPGALIADAIRKVFYEKVADLSNSGKGLYNATLKATLGLAAIGIIPFGSIVIFGPNLFAFIFGEEWRAAGVYASWLAIWVYFMFCNVPSISVILVVGLQKQLLILETITITTRVISLATGAYLKNALLAIILFALSGVIINLTLISFVIIYLFRKSKKSA